MYESLKHKTVTNISYNFLSRLLVFGLSSVASIILARHLSAADYGIVGFAIIFVGFLQQFNDLGVTPSIIRKERVEEKDLRTAFTLKILLSLLIFSISFAWGAVSQRIFDDPAVKSVVVVLALNLLISSLGFLPNTILTRELKFKRLTIPQVCSQAVATAFAIITVYLGFRYWSIVYSSLAGSIMYVLIVYMLCPVKPKLGWDPLSAKEHLKFGSHLFFSGLMVFALFNADNFVIGAVGGAATLGIYEIAFNWSTKATCIIGDAIHSVLLSTFSRVQQDTERLKTGYLAALEYVSFGAVLANILIMILSRELLVLVLGGGTGKWLPAMSSLDILCIYGAERAILEPVGKMIVAIGMPALLLKSNSIVAFIQLAFLYPALKYFGIEGVAVLVTASYALQFLIYFPALYKQIGLRFSDVFRSVHPALLSGSALACFGFAINRFMGISWLSILIKLVVGCGLYLIVYGVTTRWKILKQAMEIVGPSLSRSTRTSA